MYTCFKLKRKGKISRKTKETSISVDINIDGKGKYKIDTGIGFLNHMLEQLSKHSSIDMNIKARVILILTYIIRLKIQELQLEKL